jgi:hypothetical protein
MGAGHQREIISLLTAGAPLMVNGSDDRLLRRAVHRGRDAVLENGAALASQ